MRLARTPLGALTVLALAAFPGLAAGQDPGPQVGDSSCGICAALGHTDAALRPHATVAVAVLRIPAGSAQDQEGFEGTAHLLGLERAEGLRAVLDTTRAVVRVRVDRTATRFTVLALPAYQETVLAALDSVVFSAPTDVDLFEAVRARARARLRFEAGSPVEEFRNQTAALIAGASHPWSTPVEGTGESLARLSPLSLDLYRRSWYHRASAALAVVGPAGMSPGGTAPATRVPAPGTEVTPAPDSTATAWVRGDTIRITREITNAWVAVAVPLPRGFPRTPGEFLAHILREDLDPVPPDPDVYGVEVRIEDSPGGPVLLLEGATAAEGAERFLTRAVSALESLAETPIPEDFFRWRRRRFRARVLLGEAAPERQGARMAADLLRTGMTRRMDEEIWALTPGRVRDLAARLASPRVLIVGPDLAGR
ncbi:MAG: hypothetical protein ACE5GJ_06075 [Gemmatimonadota bacterium]